MATIRKIGSSYYSNFMVQGRQIRRFLSKNEREAWLKLGPLVERMKAETTGQRIDKYPWTELRRRLFDDNERGKMLKGLQRDIAAFVEMERFFFKDQKRPLSYVAEVTPDILRKMVAFRQKAGKKPATIKRESAAIKAAMRWAETIDPPLRLPADWAKVKTPKIGKKRPPHHEREELALLIKSIPEGRWKLLAWLGARAGLRRGEILHLQPKDIKVDRGVISITGKDCDRCAECRHSGGRWQPKDIDERDIPLMPDLEAYLKTVWGAIKGREWAMDDLKDHRPSLEELSVYFKRLTRKAGLRGGVHTLRHTFGCHMADDGVPIPTLQKWLGHASIQTTMIYVSPAKDDAAYIARVRPIPL